jgi:hypothetical protein
MILNVEGSALTNPRKAEFGGLVRNHEGSFQLSFYSSVRISNVLHGEKKSLLLDIKLCWQTSFKKLLCFSDPLNVIKLLTMGTNRFHPYANLVGPL